MLRPVRTLEHSDRDPLLTLTSSDDCIDLGQGSSAGDQGPAHRPHEVERFGDVSDHVFFRITHTGLGRHKFFEKGSVATHDLGIHIVPVIGVRAGDGEGAVEVVLDISIGAENSAKLATWMGDNSVSFDDLRKHMKVWKASERQEEFLDVNRVNLQHYVHRDDHHACLTFLRAFVLTGAYGCGGSVYVAAGHAEEDLRVLKVMSKAGLIVESGIGYKFLV